MCMARKAVSLFWFSIPDFSHCRYSPAGFRWSSSIYHSHPYYYLLQVKLVRHLSVTPNTEAELYPSLFKWAIWAIVKWASVSQALSRPKEKTKSKLWRQGWACWCPSAKEERPISWHALLLNFNQSGCKNITNRVYLLLEGHPLRCII